MNPSWSFEPIFKVQNPSTWLGDHCAGLRKKNSNVAAQRSHFGGSWRLSPSSLGRLDPPTSIMKTMGDSKPNINSLKVRLLFGYEKMVARSTDFPVLV